jgi:hypothetical protein
MGPKMIPSSEKLEAHITAIGIGLRVLESAQLTWRTIICKTQNIEEKNISLTATLRG